MPHGCRTRRTTTWFAGILLALTPASGCQRLAVSRVQPVSLPPSATTTAATSAPPAWPGPGSLTEQEATPRATPPAASEPAPIRLAIEGQPLEPSTPLLDAALERVRSEELAQGARVHDDAPRPVPDEPRTAVPSPDLAQTAVDPEPKPVSEPEPEPLPRAVILEATAAERSAEPKTDPRVEAAAALVPDRIDEPEVRARPIDPEKPVAPARPRDIWREGLDRLRSVARDQVRESGGDADGQWTLRSRLLDWLDESSSRTETIRGAAEALEALCPLQITDLQLCRKVKGFGDFEPLEAMSCRPGHGVIIYCEMAGVRYESEGSQHRSRLASRVEVVAASGSEPVWTQSLGTADDLCRRRRRDYYVNYRVTLPESLSPGSYELRLIQDDLIANQTATRSVPLVIQR